MVKRNSVVEKAHRLLLGVSQSPLRNKWKPPKNVKNNHQITGKTQHVTKQLEQWGVQSKKRDPSKNHKHNTRKNQNATTCIHRGTGPKGGRENRSNLDIDLGDVRGGRTSHNINIRVLPFTHKMGAHKHHCLVCLHTPQHSFINANPHNLPTKLSHTNDNTHNLPTKLSPLHFNSNKLPTKLLPINDNSPIQIPFLDTNLYKTFIKLPPRSTSTIQKYSTHNNIAIATHTTQNHTHEGKQNHLHLPPSKHTPQKTPKMQLHTIYKPTSKKKPPLNLASPHGRMSTPPIPKPHKNPYIHDNQNNAKNNNPLWEQKTPNPTSQNGETLTSIISRHNA